MTLEQFFEAHPKVALGFSGGVDSSYLLHYAVGAGADVAAYFVKTPFQPAFELEDARDVAEFAGAPLRLVEVDILGDPRVRGNPQDRCYHCKKAIFTKIREVAAGDGYETLIDGTNASDDAGDRPGMRALAELAVLSPLRLCGLSKEDVRARSREAGLFTHDKPSYSCLATRIPAGEALSAERLAVVEAAEAFLRSLGFGDFRVRVRGGEARIELPEEEMIRVIVRRGEIVKSFEGLGIDSISLDLRPR